MPALTLLITNGVNDAYVGAEGATYPPTPGTDYYPTLPVVQVFRYAQAGPYYFLQNGLLRFSTSSLPDVASITDATLHLAVDDKISADSRSITADYYDWVGSIADYTTTAGTSAISGVAISSIAAIGSVHTFTLENVAANITATADVGIRLHVSEGVPSGANYVSFAALEHATLQEPRLTVTYTLPNDYYLPYESDRTGKKKRTQTFAI